MKQAKKYRYTGTLRGYMPCIGNVGPRHILTVEDESTQYSIDQILKEDADAGRPPTFVPYEEESSETEKPTHAPAEQTEKKKAPQKLEKGVN